MIIAQRSKIFHDEPEVLIPLSDFPVRWQVPDFVDRIPQPMNTVRILYANVGTSK
jgi:hypothetical protein